MGYNEWLYAESHYAESHYAERLDARTTHEHPFVTW
jgi:hypothetical protein